MDKIETEITGPAVYEDSIRAVKLMAAVALNAKNLERIEISGFEKGGVIKWNVPEGTWKIMLFSMVKDSFHSWKNEFSELGFS